MQNPPKIETVEQASKVLEHAEHDLCLGSNPGASDGRGMQ